MIRIIGQKTLYNLDNEQALKQWGMEPVKNFKNTVSVNLTSGLKIAQSFTKNYQGNIGYFYTDGNNINKNAQSVALFTGTFGHGHGYGICKQNYERVIVSFAARKLIIANWINSKDEYLAPDESNPEFEEFVNDSIIFSLFHIHSNQSSLRNIFIKNNEKE